MPPTPKSPTRRSSRKRDDLPLETFLRTDTRLHRAILKQMQRGISHADRNNLTHAPRIFPNLLRFFEMNDKVYPIFEEQGFEIRYKGAQTIFKKRCAATQTVVAVLLTRARRVEDTAHEVFQVNPKSPGLAVRIGDNYADASGMESLFSMEELISSHTIEFGAFQRSSVETTIFLLWETNADHIGPGENEEITVYFAKPISIGENNTLIQCEWVQKIGRFIPALGDIANVPPADDIQLALTYALDGA